MSDTPRQRVARQAYYRAQQGRVWDALNGRMDDEREVAEDGEEAIFAALFERATLAQKLND